MNNQSKQTFVLTAKDKTKGAFKSVRKGLNGLGKGLAGISATGVAALGAIAKSSLDTNSELTKLSKSLNVGVKELGQWSYAAETVGISGEKMADIFKDVSDKIGDFAITGGGGAADMFERLNLDVKDFINLSPDKQLEKVGEALQGVSTQSEKIFFLEALAGDASQLLPLLDDNAEALQALKDEAEATGYALSEIDAAKLKAANDALDRSKKATQGLANKITVGLAPYIEALSTSFAKLGGDSIDWGKTTSTAIDWVVKGAGFLANGLRGIEILFYAIKGGGALAFGGLLGIMDAVASGVAALGNRIKNGIITPLAVVVSTGNAIGLVSDEVVDKLIQIDIQKFRSPKLLKDGMESAFKVAEDAFTKMDEKLQAPLPSKGIDAWAEGVKAKAAELEQEIATKVNQPLAFAANVATKGDEDADAEDQKLIAAAEKRALRLTAAQEEANLLLGIKANQHEQELALLNDNFARYAELKLQQYELEKTAEHERFEIAQAERATKFENELAMLGEEHALRQELKASHLAEEQAAAQTHADKLTEIQRRQKEEEIRLAQQAKKAKDAIEKGGLIGSLKSITQIGGQIFGKSKKLAKAQALVSLPTAVIDTFKNNGGYPWGIAPAALMAAAGLKQIQQIDKTNVNGGGSAVTSFGGGGGSSSGGSPSIPKLPASGSQFQNQKPNTPPPIVNIQLHGSTAAVVDEIRQQVDDGDLELIGTESRNGQDLIAAAAAGGG